MTRAVSRSTVGAGAVRRGGQLRFPERVRGWELVQLAAEGALARIYRARPTNSSTDRPAAHAVKMLRPELESDPRAVGTLYHEALVGRKVSHPHLVSVLAAALDEPPYFVVMPWLDGSTLAELLACPVHLDLPVVLWIARQVSEALGALDQAGWMHGDVKPSNIFISPGMHVTLLDLGFARSKEETGSVVDRCVMGTCNYIAPEMITSALGADIRSDMYSLGAALFEALSGRLPFQGKDLAEVATQHKQASVPELRRLAPHLPTGVIRLVRQMLAKEPLRRPQTPGELIERLVVLEIETFAERRTG